jgi:hypothetical protein
MDITQFPAHLEGQAAVFPSDSRVPAKLEGCIRPERLFLLLYLQDDPGLFRFSLGH